MVTKMPRVYPLQEASTALKEKVGRAGGWGWREGGTGLLGFFFRSLETKENIAASPVKGLLWRLMYVCQICVCVCVCVTE